MSQEQMMQALAHALSTTLGPNVGFVLLTSNFGEIDGGRVNYVSNGRREDMIAMMREYLARVDGNYHEGGQA
jgi:hypothetical protein